MKLFNATLDLFGVLLAGAIVWFVATEFAISHWEKQVRAQVQAAHDKAVQFQPVYPYPEGHGR
jgi:hypothetical protein